MSKSYYIMREPLRLFPIQKLKVLPKKKFYMKQKDGREGPLPGHN
jgi:hypothetical protein